MKSLRRSLLIVFALLGMLSLLLAGGCKKEEEAPPPEEAAPPASAPVTSSPEVLPARPSESKGVESSTGRDQSVAPASPSPQATEGFDKPVHLPIPPKPTPPKRPHP